MTTDGWLFLGALLVLSTPLLGNYMAKVYTIRRKLEPDPPTPVTS